MKWRLQFIDWLITHAVDSELAKADVDAWKKAYKAIPAIEREKFEKEQRYKWLFELDKCHGSCILDKYHGIIAAGLEYFHKKRVWLGDYVVMPNHVHLLVQPFPGVNLEEWLYSVKRFTARMIGLEHRRDIKEKMNRSNLWQAESFDRVVRNEEELLRVRHYIANNPKNLQEGTFVYKEMSWLNEFRWERTRQDDVASHSDAE
jgi:putative transposase